MAEFQEVMKQKKRMCNTRIDGCYDCVLYYKRSGKNISCSKFCSEYPQQAEEIIMKWAEENRIQTNAEKFKEVFGVKLLDDLCNNISCDVKCDECDLHIFCQQEYKEPKGE